METMEQRKEKQKLNEYDCSLACGCLLVMLQYTNAIRAYVE